MDAWRTVRGTVVHGDSRGRALGFPTANVDVPDPTDLPSDGIYAGWLWRAQGDVLPSAISVGKRPTFHENANSSLLEVHVLDWSGDLYGETVTVEFVCLLRKELRFDDINALIAQMDSDCEAARTLLKRGEPLHGH